MKAKEFLHILKAQNKRLFIILIIVLIAFISLLGYVLYLLNNIGTIGTTTEVEQSDAENNNFIGNNGDIINGAKDKAN